MRTSLRRSVLAACAALILAVPTAVAAQHSTAAPGSIPAPDQYFGFHLGSDGHLATFDKMDAYFRLVAKKSDRVTYQQIGKTTLGNPYSMLTISSKKNLANLDKLMASNDRLADPRGLSPTEAQKLARQGKPFYYDELQSGWLIGGDYLKGAANTVSWQVGKGHVVTFGNQSAFRTWNRAEQKMIFNALYYGPAQKVTPSTFSKLGD